MVHVCVCLAGCDVKDLERLSHPMRPVPLHQPVPVSEGAKVVGNVHPASVIQICNIYSYNIDIIYIYIPGEPKVAEIQGGYSTMLR